MKKLFAVMPLLLAFALPIFAQQMFNSCVENETADCPVTLPTSFNTANSKLPDPFKKLDGTRISGKEDWACRRQEILKLAEKTIYGEKPPKPASVTGTVSRTSISVNVSEGGKSGSFSVTVTMPSSGSAPYPAVISYGNSGISSSTATSNGVAFINFTPTTVGGENQNNGRARSGVFYNIYGTNHKAGTLIAWAWAVSRIIDVIEGDPNKLLDPTAIGVTGCSRFGKGPFVAGAFDQRIALTMPMEGGTGGSNLMRLAHSTSGAQSPNSAYGEQPWLGDVFSGFTSNPNNLPVDMHEVAAMIAPRGLLFLDKTPESSDWLCTQASYGAAQAAAEVYKALGVGSSLHYISNTGSSGHCSWNNVYNEPVADFIKKYLLRTKEVTGNTPTFNAANSSRNPNMSNLIDWTTPTLSGELTIGGCGPAPSGFVLTITASPSAGGTVNTDPPSSSGRFEAGQKVTLTAVPSEGWMFDGWDGDASGAGASVEINMSRNKSVTAKFLRTADGTGTGAGDSGTTSIGSKNPASATAGKKLSNLRATPLSNSAINVAFTASNSGEAILKLYNLKGNAVSAAKLKTVAGVNYSHTFNMVKIPKGSYLVGLHSGGKVQQARVVVTR